MLHLINECCLFKFILKICKAIFSFFNKKIFIPMCTVVSLRQILKISCDFFDKDRCQKGDVKPIKFQLVKQNCC